uniref:PABPN1 like, cytoplasmic n=1 Tax=Naja naja TaxID=35670 RepID=A0A8C6XJ99_NAJNA
MEGDSASSPVEGANQEVQQAEDPVSLTPRRGPAQREPLVWEGLLKAFPDPRPPLACLGGGGLGRAPSRDSSVPGEEGCFSCSTSTLASLGVKELEAIKAKVRAMEKDDEWLQELQNEAKSLLVSSDPGTARAKINEKKVEADQRSIYVGNVDYGGTAEELESYFNSCGQINRVTILCDKFSGHPKGYAYIEFADQSSLKAAMELDEGTFRGRVIKVLPKRTNFPGISSTDRGGSRGRFRGRGALPRHANFCGGQCSRPRGRLAR